MRFAKPRWTNSLAARLLRSQVIALVMLAVLLSVLPMLLQRFDARGLMEHALVDDAELLIESLRFDAAGEPVAMALPRESAWIYASLSSDMRYRVVDATGRVALSSQAGSTALAPEGRRFLAQPERFALNEGGRTLEVVTMPLKQGAQPWYVQATTTQQSARLTRLGLGFNYVRLALVPILFTLVLVSAAVVLTLRRQLMPLREASVEAARIAPRNLGARLATARLPTELHPLVEAFNQALARLESGFKVQQQFLATAAHELKTPLALMRGQIELDGIDGAGDRAALLHDIDLMSRQVQQLLHLAEASEPANYAAQPIDAAEAVGEAVDYMSRLADRQQVHLRYEPEGAAAGPLLADRGALFVLLKNLLENAIHHCPPGGAVRVLLGAGALRIRNDGEPIAAEHLPQLFERFWRGPSPREDGAGLGLTICREIAEAHGWTLNARNTEEGVEFAVGWPPGASA